MVAFIYSDGPHLRRMQANPPENLTGNLSAFDCARKTVVVQLTLSLDKRFAEADTRGEGLQMLQAARIFNLKVWPKDLSESPGSPTVNTIAGVPLLAANLLSIDFFLPRLYPWPPMFHVSKCYNYMARSSG